MPYKSQTVYEKISHNLFRSKDETKLVLTADEQKIKERFMLYITKILDEPLIKDTVLLTYIEEVVEIKKSQFYRDMAQVRLIIGNIKNSTKEWIRYSITEELKKQYQKADTANDSIAAIMALDKIAKYHKLDKDEEELMPWDQLIPPDFELSDDVRVLDQKLFDPKIDERREKMRARFNKATDTDFENV